MQFSLALLTLVGLATATPTADPAFLAGRDIAAQYGAAHQGVQKRCNHDQFQLCIAGCTTGCAFLPNGAMGCINNCRGSCSLASGQGDCA